MNLSDLDNHDDRYTKLINALEPRHAPETSMRFTPPALQRRRSFFSLLGRISRIAAVLIVGIGIGLCVVRPDYAIAARKVLELGLEKIRTSRECSIDLNARMLPPTAKRPLNMSPNGDLVPVRMTYRSKIGKTELQIDWQDRSGSHSLEINSGEKVRLDGNIVEEEMPSQAFNDLSDILFSGAESMKKVIGDKKIKVTKSNDNIMLDLVDKNGEFHAVFSDRSGRLISLKGYDKSGGTPLLMVETTSITYN